MFSNNFCYAGLVDKELFRRSNTRNNHFLLVSEQFCNFHIHRKIDKRLWAFPPLFYGRSLGK